METRTCKKCDEEQSIDRFPSSGYTTKAGKLLRRHTCYQCYYKHNTSQQTQRTREWFEEYKKQLKCNRCTESDFRCLDFHHIDPSQKSFDVSYKASRGCGKELILSEIAKCEVVCSNCHRKLTYDDRKFARLD